MNRTIRLAQSLVLIAEDHGRISRAVTAMRVHNLSPTKLRSVNFVAFRKDLWVGSYDRIQDVSEDIIEAILEAHPRGEEIEKYARGSTDDACSFVRDYIPDAVCGWFNRETKQIGIESGSSVSSSPLVRKVLEALRGRSVEQTDADEKSRLYRRNRVKGDWDWRRPFYHGTSSEYFEGIVRLGLMPMPHQSNYKEIIHDDAIFLTPMLSEAEHHAFHTARGEYNVYTRKHPKNFVPMVVSVMVPDPARVIPDYDVDQASSATWYNHSNDPSQFYSVGSEKASKHAGLFGYKGRIPAKFIRALYFYSFANKEWMRLTPDKFAKAISGVQNWGEDFWYTRLGYPEDER